MLKNLAPWADPVKRINLGRGVPVMPRFHPLLALAALLALTAAAGAADTATPIPLNSDACDHTFARAGHPELISRCARPSDTCAYAGYYVGGGCVLRGGPPGPLEGTWGWDYFGPCWLPHRVVLGWCERCRYQGGVGAYRTDGPHVPNVFGVKLPPREPEWCAK